MTIAGASDSTTHPGQSTLPALSMAAYQTRHGSAAGQTGGRRRDVSSNTLTHNCSLIANTRFLSLVISQHTAGTEQISAAQLLQYSSVVASSSLHVCGRGRMQ